MRIASLVPSATEALFALGLGDQVVGVTHECDFPPAAADLPHLTDTVIPSGLSSLEIDQAVRERTQRGEALYRLADDRLEALAPDLIVTQAVCAVCAVSVDDVRAVAASIPSQPRVISLDPSTLGEVLSGVSALAEAAEVPGAGATLVRDLGDRLERVERAVDGAERTAVAALEWLDPVFAGGHWVPQQIELAGGVDVLGLAGEHSRVVEWAELAAGRPEVILVMPCGYGTERSAREAHDHAERLLGVGAERILAVDASSYFSRPGPRLVDGVELLGHLLHPDFVPAPPPGRSLEIQLLAAR
jgi:iron complex transport system substrate-binding protein